MVSSDIPLSGGEEGVSLRGGSAHSAKPTPAPLRRREIELVFITPEMLLEGDSQVFTNPVNPVNPL